MKQVELYNHNKTTYENITRIFETNNKCATVQPTGSGKSFLIFKLAQDNSDKTIVVFEPNKQIIGRVSEQMKEYGIDNIKFYTYQKLNSQHKRDEISIDNADYICLDELHRIKAKQWEQAIIAIQEKFPNAKVLGLTATPERMDGQNIIDYFGAELACNITLGDAIVNKILPCPTYISALYTFDEEIQRVYDKINDSRNSDEEKNDMRTELEVARKQLEKALGVPAILKKHIPDSNGKYLVFCQNVEHLNAMKVAIEDWFTQAGFDVHMYFVHTKNPNHKTEYSEFKADNSDCIKLCLCIDMFNEGVHLEGISGVILLRPTQSNIIYFQQIGRAISASDKNIPIIFDLVNNGNCLGYGNFRTEIESAVERQREEIAECSDNECDKEFFDIGNFHIYDYVKDSLGVLNGIEGKCVNNWLYHFKQFLEYKEKYKTGAVIKENAKEWNGLEKWAISQRAEFRKNKLSEKAKTILNQNGFLWEVREYTWDDYYNLCKEYIEKYNKGITQKTVFLDVPIGTWYHNNIRYAQRNKLPQDKMDAILNLNGNSDNWKFQNKIEHIKEYIYNGGKLPITENYVCEDGFKLGQCIKIFKRSFKMGTLKEKYINELTDLGIDLSSQNFDDIWMETYNLCIEYIQKFKKEPSCKTIYMNTNIGAWLYNNKDRYKKGKLDQEKIDLLKKIKTFSFDKKEEDLNRWFIMYNLCLEYMNTHKSIYYKEVYKGERIGQWITTQKEKYRNNQLSQRQCDLLLRIGIDFEYTLDKEWKTFISAVKECLQTNSQIFFRTTFNNIGIGRRLYKYRNLYKQGKFPKERYQQLLELGIDLAKEGSLM